MMRVLVIMLSFIFLISCSSSHQGDLENADLIGYVIDKTEQGMLVVSEEPIDFSETGGKSEYYEATWLSETPDDIEIGELVAVWFDGPVAESYPMQATLGQIKVVSKEPPDGADLSVAEALREAIDIQGQTAAIKEIFYDQELDRWSITFKDLMSENESTIFVED